MVFSYFTGTTLETADGGDHDNVTEDSGSDSDDSTLTEQVVAQLPSGC